jgi:hypothetical protein
MPEAYPASSWRGNTCGRTIASTADWAEDVTAIDYASWTVDNARLAVLDAIDARAYADELCSQRPASLGQPAVQPAGGHARVVIGRQRMGLEDDFDRHRHLHRQDSVSRVAAGQIMAP